MELDIFDLFIIPVSFAEGVAEEVLDSLIGTALGVVESLVNSATMMIAGRVVAARQSNSAWVG